MVAGLINEEIPFDVSRETIEQLEILFSLLKKWQPRINLISPPKSLADESLDIYIWKRHFLDSLQIYPLLDNSSPILDIGSGGGFPGLVVAACGIDDIYLVESDRRKCEFLKEASRQMGVRATIVNDRFENLSASDYDNKLTITSRACASITKLLWLTRQFHDVADYVLLKGEQLSQELSEAENDWQMSTKTIKSITNENSSIVMIQGVRPNAKK